MIVLYIILCSAMFAFTIVNMWKKDKEAMKLKCRKPAFWMAMIVCMSIWPAIVLLTSCGVIHGKRNIKQI